MSSDALPTVLDSPHVSFIFALSHSLPPTCWIFSAFFAFSVSLHSSVLFTCVKINSIFWVCLCLKVSEVNDKRQLCRGNRKWHCLLFEKFTLYIIYRYIITLAGEDKEVVLGWFTVICASFSTDSARSKAIIAQWNSFKRF